MRPLKIFLVAMVFVASAQVTALAANTERLEIINDTGQIIESLYIAPVGNTNWGKDFAEEYPFDAYQKKIIKYNPAIRYFKLKFTLWDGREIVWQDDKRLDFSRAWRLILYSGKRDEIKYTIYKLPDEKSKRKSSD